MRAEAEYIRHAGEYRYDVSRSYQPRTNIRSDGAFAIFPISRQTDIASDAYYRQANQKNGYLDETDIGFAVHMKKGWLGAEQKDQESEKCRDQT